jgi:hypothetical protein
MISAHYLPLKPYLSALEWILAALLMIDSVAPLELQELPLAEVQEEA